MRAHVFSIFQRDLLPTVRLRRSLVVSRRGAAQHVAKAAKLMSFFHRRSLSRFSPKLMDKMADRIQKVSSICTLAQEKSRQWVLSMREVMAPAEPTKQEDSQTVGGASVVLCCVLFHFEDRILLSEHKYQKCEPNVRICFVFPAVSFIFFTFGLSLMLRFDYPVLPYLV